MQGFCAQPPLHFTAGMWSDVLFSVTFPPSPSGTGIAFQGWSKFATVRGDSLAGFLQEFSHYCMQTLVPGKIIMHIDLHRYGHMQRRVALSSLWSHELWQLCFNLILGSLLLHPKTHERCCDTQGSRMFIYEPICQILCLIFTQNQAACAAW